MTEVSGQSLESLKGLVSLDMESPLHVWAQVGAQVWVQGTWLQVWASAWVVAWTKQWAKEKGAQAEGPGSSPVDGNLHSLQAVENHGPWTLLPTYLSCHRPPQVLSSPDRSPAFHIALSVENPTVCSLQPSQHRTHHHVERYEVLLSGFRIVVVCDSMRTRMRVYNCDCILLPAWNCRLWCKF